MKSGDYVVRNGLRQKIVNAKGKFFTQFMSGDVSTKENLSKRKALEEGVKMEGYDVNVSKQATTTSHTDVKHQPMAGHSEFWLG